MTRRPQSPRTSLRSRTFLVPLFAMFIGVAALPGSTNAASYGSAEAGFWGGVNPSRHARSAHQGRRSSKTHQHRPAASEAAPKPASQGEVQPSQAIQDLVRETGTLHRVMVQYLEPNVVQAILTKMDLIDYLANHSKGEVRPAAPSRKV